MNSELILALDIGTSSTRTALFDSCGERLAGTTAQQTYPLITTADGGAELDPPVLLGAVLHCLEQTMRAYRADPALHGRPIAGIGVSCFWHSLLGCDARGSAMTRIFTWADSRCREDAAELRKEFPEKETHARTGCMMRTSFWPAKLRWLRRIGAAEILCGEAVDVARGMAPDHARRRCELRASAWPPAPVFSIPRSSRGTRELLKACAISAGAAPPGER